MWEVGGAYREGRGVISKKWVEQIWGTDLGSSIHSPSCRRTSMVATSRFSV